MTTNELEGRALAEAAARAMGWKKLQGSETWDDGTYLRTMGQRPMTERECLAWLHERGFLHTFSGSGKCHATIVGTYGSRDDAGGLDLLEALQRLVVAVAAREVKQ